MYYPHLYTQYYTRFNPVNDMIGIGIDSIRHEKCLPKCPPK